MIPVKDGLASNTWMTGLHRINSAEAIDQFLYLWEMTQPVNLTDIPDEISWIFSAQGTYSAKVAYDVQFLGHIPQPHLNRVWKLKVEGNVKFFLWLTLQGRIWTADRLQNRGWPNNPICCLCDQEPETAVHIILGCSFSKQVWALFSASHGNLATIGGTTTTINKWWRKIHCMMPKEKRMEAVSVASYTAWHIWLEPNRRTFQAKSCNPVSIYQMICDDLCLHREAFRE